MPHYDGPDFRARRTPEAATGEPDEAATQMLPEQDVPTYRPRDYSPEGRGSHAAPVNAEPVAPPMPATTSSPVERAPQSTEYTLTRRELRALREAQGAQVDAPAPRSAPSSFAPQPVAPEPVAPEPVAPEPVAPEPVASEPVASEPVASEPVASEPVASEPVASVSSEPAVPAQAPVLSPFEALFAPPSDSAPAPLVEPLVDPTAAVGPEPGIEPVAPEPEVVVAEPAAAEPVVAETVVAEPVAAEPVVAEPVAAEPAISEPPTAPATRTARRAGHWSTQADLDDATQVNESTISRKVGAGSGAITTSALVLPSLPNPEFAHLGTGEILVTGSIDLPHSLATSGAHPTQLDEHHLDHELDPGDHQVVSTDSQPVRAVKAISSHTSTRNVIVAKKPVGNRALTALIISAAGMAAVVVTLLVVGLVSGVL
ncbi:hypothetical protein GCM10025881_33490 [Pseudolysinimonas kribbensis]|uniref:Uncharacterized protein n=1 Tax=Pseudolysinimonas kribbensis TaxID=433641 RepID=A0ABQ6K798_9MICO|nr:hypothetical protein GCM10025881_33490 [Pseudolysinimonas kribbensis]